MEAGCFRYKIKSFISDKYIFKQIILQTNKQNSAEGVRQPKLLYTPVAEAISFHQHRYYVISPQAKPCIHTTIKYFHYTSPTQIHLIHKHIPRRAYLPWKQIASATKLNHSSVINTFLNKYSSRRINKIQPKAYDNLNYYTPP